MTKGPVKRGGNYHARKRVPDDVREIIGKNELWQSLKTGSRREANARLPFVLADFERTITAARAKLHGSESPISSSEWKHPLTVQEMASLHYARQIKHDENIRDSGGFDFLNAMGGYRERLQLIASGRATDQQIYHCVPVAMQIGVFRDNGNHDLIEGSPKWRHLARSIAAAWLESFKRSAERDVGDFSGQPQHPDIDVNANIEPPLSIRELFNEYCDERERLGISPKTRLRWTPAIESLIKFIKHDNARKLTKKQVIDWKNKQLGEWKVATVKRVHLAAVNAVFTWAVENDRIASNPVTGVRMSVPKEARSREKGFRDDEALAILRASRNHKRSKKEAAKTAAAKQWVPILCAHTGARVTEIVQLRKQDVFERDGITAIRITGEAGAIKERHYKDVPLHPQLITEGFVDFIERSPEGYLFIEVTHGEDVGLKADSKAGDVRRWLKEHGLVPEGMQAHHGWRHRFNTISWEHGLNARVVDAIQGHAPRTAGENYGDVTLKARYREIKKMPSYDLK
ncbi:DUF6538 domain-containing protein [Hoeflea sp. CAU 1731]